MSDYELQIPETGWYCDRKIRAAEAEVIEILSSVAPGSRLNEMIHNPIGSIIDEG